MTKEEQALVLLHHCRGVGYRTLEKILKQKLSFSRCLSFTITEWVNKGLIKKEHKEIFEKDLNKLTYSTIHSTYQKKGIHIITIFNQRYPRLLKEIDTPPFVLYAKGKIEWLQEEKMLGIVGSRKMSEYSQKNLFKILPPLLQDNWFIVSGLAKGVDALSHRLTIHFGGKTIGVLGSGFGHFYPKENQELAKEMMQTQLIITEYPYHYPPRKWQFPFRNRIISGLSLGTFVLEAKEKSGSLITAHYALEQGRQVFACPGPPFLDAFVGTNELILNGAKLVQSGVHIIEEFSYLST